MEKAKRNRFPLQVLLTPEERAEIDARAAVEGLPASTWLRRLALTTEKKEELRKEEPNVTP